MSARPRRLIRSHPGRVAAAVVAVLLASGAVVAAVTDAPTGSGGAHKSLASNGLKSETLNSATLNSGSGASGAGRAFSADAVAGKPESLTDPTSGASEVASSRSAVGAGAPAEPPGAPVSPGVGPAVLGGQPVPAAVAAGTARIVKTASLTVSVKKGGLGDNYQRAVDAAAAVGGWVQTSQTGTDQASLTLKVPSDKLETVVGTIRGLGKVTSVAENGEDVTAEFVDLEARIGHWRAQEAVFVGLMGKAKTIPETISIQQQLSSIQEQIEQLEGRRKYLDGQTAFSTLRLSLLEEGAVAPSDADPKAGSTLSRAWERAGGAALSVLAGTIVVLGVVLPLAGVIGIPAWALAVLVRRRDRRQAAAA